jgi:hypothetical protein
MITCYLRYVIDPYKLPEFEKYSRMIMPSAVSCAPCSSEGRS